MLIIKEDGAIISIQVAPATRKEAEKMFSSLNVEIDKGCESNNRRLYRSEIDTRKYHMFS